MKQFLFCTAFLFLFSCSPVRVSEENFIPEGIPEQFSRRGSQAVNDRWWEDFQDPFLNKLVDKGLEGNYDLQAMWARFLQAEAVAAKAGAFLIPEISAAGDAYRGRVDGNSGRVTSNRFQAGFQLSYELDIWRRIDSTENAASYEAVRLRELTEATALMLVADISNTWFTVKERREQLRLLRGQRKTSSMFLELIELRFGQGSASAVEVFQQREQVASVETQIPIVRSSLEEQITKLAVLTGNVPGKKFRRRIMGKVDKPVSREYVADLEKLLNQMPESGVPAEVLLKRPDMRAAQAKLTAADYQVAAAVADRLPALRISGSSNYQDTEAEDIFSNWIWNLAGNIALPLIDGGRRSAEVDRTEAAVMEVIANYQKTALTALKEIEDSYQREYYQQRYLEKLAKQLDWAEKAYREARERYAVGLTEYLSVLAELRAMQAAERAFILGQKNRVAARINLYKALGASWTRAMETPEIKDVREKDNAG